MKTAIALLFAIASLAFGASFNSYTVTFTNTTANGNKLTVDSLGGSFTSAPLNSVSWIQSGNSNVSATNFFRWLSANKPLLIIYPLTNGVVYFGGLDLVASLSGSGFGFMVTNSVLSTNQYTIQYPFAALPSSVAATQANELSLGLGEHATLPLPAYTPLLSYYAGLTNEQTLTRKTLTAPFINGGTNTGTVLSNAPWGNIGNLTASNIVAHGGNVTNINATGLTINSGTVGGLSNGVFHGATLSNSPAVNTTNLQAQSGFVQNLTGVNVWFTNFSAPGSASFSQQIGGTATNTAAVQYGRNGVAGGLYDVSLGAGAVSYQMPGDTAGGYNVTIGYGEQNQGRYNVIIGGNNGGIVGSNNIVIGTENTLSAPSAKYSGLLGHAGSASYDYSFSIGYGAETEREREIRIGGPSQHVVIKALTNSTAHSTTFNGTNFWHGDISWSSATYGSLVNSPANNVASAINLGTNYIVELSGATTIANICSFPDRRVNYEFRAIFSGAVSNVLVNNSAAEGTSALRIKTGTGGDVVMTNQPAWATFLKRSGDWLLLEHSR